METPFEIKVGEKVIAGPRNTVLVQMKDGGYRKVFHDKFYPKSPEWVYLKIPESAASVEYSDFLEDLYDNLDVGYSYGDSYNNYPIHNHDYYSNSNINWSSVGIICLLFAMVFCICFITTSFVCTIFGCYIGKSYEQQTKEKNDEIQI